MSFIATEMARLWIAGSVSRQRRPEDFTPLGTLVGSQDGGG